MTADSAVVITGKLFRSHINGEGEEQKYASAPETEQRNAPVGCCPASQQTARLSPACRQFKTGATGIAGRQQSATDLPGRIAGQI